MAKRRRPTGSLVGVAVGVAFATISLAAPSSADPSNDGTVFGEADDDSVVVGIADDGVVVVPADNSTPPPAYAYRRVAEEFCGTNDSTGTDWQMCIDGADSGVRVTTCPDGSAALDPLYRRPLDAAGNPTGPWERVDDGGCAEDLEPIVLTAEDFRRLPLTPSTPRLQPADGRALVNVPLIVFTDPEPQQLQTTVLGVPVTVRATPTSWTWDFGDRSTPLTTTDPGHPYPDHTLAHPYATPGTYTVTVTTTWTGQFQVNGTGPWQDVDGTAQTTSAPIPITTEEAPSRLVAEPLP